MANQGELKWEVARHQVAVDGWVIDGQTQKPVSGAEVTISQMPAVFKKAMELKAMRYGKREPEVLQLVVEGKSNKEIAALLDISVNIVIACRTRLMESLGLQTRTGSDGHFYFVDLPNGKYTFSASLPSSGKRYGSAQETATVSRDAKGKMKMASVKFILRPTTIKGKITGSAHKNGVVMAEVRIKGSGERAFSDAQGQYVLAGLEPGKRTVLVFAQGYDEDSRDVDLTTQTLEDFRLVRASGENAKTTMKPRGGARSPSGT